MRVLHIQKVKGIAGSEKHLLTLVPALARVGYQPEMLVLANNHEEASTFVEQMRRFSVPTAVMLIKGHVDVGMLFKLRKWIAQRKFDLVHTHLFHADLYGTLAARLAGVRVVVSTKHGYAPWREKRFYGWLDRQASNFQASLIVISEAMGEWLNRAEGLPTKKMRTVHYALDGSSFRTEKADRAFYRTSRGPYIGSVSRLLEQKGIDTLVRAFKGVLANYPEAVLLIAGDGPQRGNLEQLADDLAVRRHIRFIGFQNDISQMMNELDLFVFPTFGEGFGLVLLEAMACEKAIVASNVTSIPEIIIDRETGLLVPPGDPAAFAEAICVLLNNPELRGHMGAKGRRRLESLFTVERMIEETARVYEDALEEVQPGNPT